MPSLFDLHDAALAEQEAQYENPVVDNLAEVAPKEEPFEFYDVYEGPLSGRGQPGTPSRENVADKLAMSLAQKAQQRKAASHMFQDKTAASNKGGHGAY